MFDEFIAKTKYISPIIDSRFSSIKRIYRELQIVTDTKDANKISPLSSYLENENMSYNQLIEFIKSIGNRAKKPFRDALTNISKKNTR